MALRCVGNILFCLNCKAVKRAAQKKIKPSRGALDSLNSALAAIKENNLEIPAGLQALVTQITSQ